eukprot:scaffold1850_cov194-Pinguiococcus_pyrenoidosus.AAC.18
MPSPSRATATAAAGTPSATAGTDSPAAPEGLREEPGLLHCSLTYRASGASSSPFASPWRHRKALWWLVPRPGCQGHVGGKLARTCSTALETCRSRPPKHLVSGWIGCPWQGVFGVELGAAVWLHETGTPQPRLPMARVASKQI